MSESPPRRRKRPAWVWVISIFFLISAVSTLLSYFLIYSGTFPLEPSQEAYLKSLTVVDHTFTILLGCINLAGAITLFFLRRVALYLFAGGLGLNFALTVWHAMTKEWVTAIDGAGLVGGVIGWVILIAICVYTWRLTKSGVLK